MELLQTTTSALLEQVLRGDASHLDRLLRKAGGRVMSLIAFRMSEQLKRRMEPEDVLQEVYIEALRQLPKFENRGHGSFYAWFAALAVNKIANLERSIRAGKRDQRKELALDGVRVRRGVDTSTGLQVAAHRRSPSQAVIGWEAFHGVQKAIGDLSAMERDVLVRRYLEGLSSAETAVSLGIGISQVYFALSRALAKVRVVVGAL